MHKVINYIEQNGYIENVADLTKPPFDKPVQFVKLFDARKCAALIGVINAFRDNAVDVS